MFSSRSKFIPTNTTLDEYAVGRVQAELGDTSQERITGVIEGLLAQSYYELAIGRGQPLCRVPVARAESL